MSFREEFEELDSDSVVEGDDERTKVDKRRPGMTAIGRRLWLVRKDDDDVE
jgi:hypothetical protein